MSRPGPALPPIAACAVVPRPKRATSPGTIVTRANTTSRAVTMLSARVMPARWASRRRTAVIAMTTRKTAQPICWKPALTPSGPSTPARWPYRSNTAARAETPRAARRASPRMGAAISSSASAAPTMTTSGATRSDGSSSPMFCPYRNRTGYAASSIGCSGSGRPRHAERSRRGSRAVAPSAVPGWANASVVTSGLSGRYP